MIPIRRKKNYCIHGAENVCAACDKLGIKKIIFTSSVAVYGFAPIGTDETGEINYFNDYGRTKFAAEEVYRKWLISKVSEPVESTASTINSNTKSLVIIRPTVIFGEQNRGNVYNLLRQIASGKFPMVGNGKNRKSMNYVENVAAFIEYCIEKSSYLRQVQGTPTDEYLFNYCDEPAYDMNTLVFDVYKALGKPRKHIVHFPYWLGYFGGLCFDLLAKILHKKLAISSIRVKKFCQNTYFKSSRVGETGFVAPVPISEGIQRTIDYEFIRKVEGHTFVCE